MGSALGRRQAAEKKERKTKEAKAKLNSKVPQLHFLFASFFFFDIICSLKMSSHVFHIMLNYSQTPSPVPVPSLPLLSLLCSAAYLAGAVLTETLTEC